MPAPTIESIIAAVMGYRRAKVLMVAAYLDFFTRLRTGKSAARLARELGLNRRATEILLDALAALGYVSKRGAAYRNTPVSDRFLVKGRPDYIGNNLKYQEIIWDAWGELRHCLKKGGALRPLDYWLIEHKGFVGEYIRGMRDIAARPAREIAEIIDLSGGKSLLDVGAGPGAYSLAFLRKNPALTATLLDLPQTLRVTRQLLKEEPELSKRVRLKPGNYLRDSFGAGQYDLVILSHVTHDESPASNRRMLERSYRALKPGGRIVVHDFLVEPSRVRPEFGALFSVHMLTYTRGGRTYTAGEYRRWLSDAGFAALRRHKICASAKNSSEIIAGVKN